MKLLIKKIIVLTTIITMNLTFLQSTSFAGIIETDTVLDEQSRSVALDKAKRFLIEDEVRQTLVDLGVNPQTVIMRVATLSDDELLQLSERIDQAPAGAGALEVIGIVFLVLLILELVGVTDVFKKL